MQRNSQASILVVDDESINFDLIEATLGPKSYQFHYVDNGIDAISNLDKFRPDLILLDVMMPGMTGVEICQHIKTLPQWSFVPIIMVTALNSKEDLAKCLSHGADDFISKPVNELELKSRVQAMLRITHKHQQLEDALQELKAAQVQVIQNEKMSGLGRLVAGLAHEINNPLTFISGNLAYLEGVINNLIETLDDCQGTSQKIDSSHQKQKIGVSDPRYSFLEKILTSNVVYRSFHTLNQQRQKLESLDFEYLKQDLPDTFKSIKTGIERVESIISSLMMFSHLNESGKKDTDIHQNIDNILLILKHRLNENDHQLPIQVTKSYDDIPSIHVHPALLNQALMNILNNAIDALESQSGLDTEEETSQNSLTHQKQITLKTSIADDHWLKIEISDNGPGMIPEVQSHIFEPFFTTKPVGQGLGMGLSISYQIITELHGGKLECFSTPNERTTLIISLPM